MSTPTLNFAAAAAAQNTQNPPVHQEQREQQADSHAQKINDAVDTTSKKKKKNKRKKKSNNQGKPVVTLVVDTNPFVKGLPLDHIATKFVTVPEVVNELRSKSAKERFESLDLKYGVKLENPDAESMQAVVRFAKQTGDFASLAMADLKVLALAFMLEKKANGMRRLRLEPVGDHPDIADRKLLEAAEDKEAEEEQDQAAGGLAEGMQELSLGPKQTGGPDADVAAKDNIEDLAEEHLSDPAQAEPVEVSAADILKSAPTDEFEVGSDEEFSEGDDFDEDYDEGDEERAAGVDDGDEEGEDDGWEVAGPKQKKKEVRKNDIFDGEWITPQNIKTHQAASAMGMRTAHPDKPKSVLKVACVTSDFAMQNVILKMGINLVTPDGVSIRRLRTWVLRCHACYTLTGDMNKQFCSSCGHPTLKRCSVTTSSNGTLQVHLKSNYQYNLRGTKFSLPKPEGGMHKVHDIITRADDKAYTSAIQYKTRKEAKTNSGLSGANSLMDPDYIPDMLIGNSLAHASGYGVATDARGLPLVGRNRKNPNAVRRTGNRKNKRRDF
ncbi:20S-pre-rRNA D-site endonuclease nob1 [Dipsacomyces acuminosporus]|nr:20S-pre-rRNA D-site endonuclease nob1 [Dipsacomyces acuminosporus]